MKRRAILVTGTVIPHSNFVAHASVEQRLQEYFDGLRFYTEMFQREDIYFLENSEYDFSKDQRFANLFLQKQITLIKFPVSDKFDQGKGYQEFEMLDQAVDRLCAQYSSFIKVTGRYKVHNLSAITNFDCEGLVADAHKKPKVVQTNVFYVTGDFYQKHLKGLYTRVDDSKGLFIEKIVYATLWRHANRSGIGLFRSNPVITGTSGSYGGTLNRNKLKMRIRNFERTLLRLFGVKQFLMEY